MSEQKNNKNKYSIEKITSKHFNKSWAYCSWIVDYFTDHRSMIEHYVLEGGDVVRGGIYD